LAAYFLGLPCEALAGMGGPFSDLMLGPDSWRLVGPDPTIAGPRMPRALALVELEDRGRLEPDSVLFQLSTDGADWKVAKQQCWSSVSDNHEIRLLAYYLLGQARTSMELRRQVLGEDSPDANDQFRKLKERLNKHFRELTGRECDLVPRLSGNLPLSLITAGIPVLGAVAVNVLPRGASRTRP